MPDTVSGTKSDPRPVWLVWFVGGALCAPATSLLSRWMPSYVAGAVSFFLLFTSASLLVVRLSRSRDVSFLRLVAASAAGAVIGGTLQYIFR